MLSCADAQEKIRRARALGHFNKASPLRVLLIAYKIRAATGSEDGSGYHIAADLAQRGCELTLISRVNNIELLRDDPLFAGVRLIGVDVPRRFGFFKRGGHGIVAYYYLWQIAVAMRARRLARELAFDVIHQLNFHTDWAPHFLSRIGKPVVWGPIAHHRFAPPSFFPRGDAHGIAREFARALVKRAFWYLDPFLRDAARRTEAILYANDDLAPPFRKQRPKIVLRPYGGSFLATSTALRTTRDVFRILFVGRLVPLKGLIPALDAFAQFAAAVGPDAPVEFRIVGDGSLRTYTIGRVRALGILDRIQITGWVAQPDLAAEYSAASVFLYPSLEAQGLVVAEAMSSGVPVISIDGTGPAALAGETGWRVPRIDGEPLIQALAGRLGEAYRQWQDDRLSAASEAARTRYESYLDWPRVGAQLGDVYRKVAETDRTVTDRPRWIRGAAGRPRYVGIGRAWPLYRSIDDLEGARGYLERLALPVGAALGRGGITQPDVQEAWDRLNAFIPGVTSALMVYTGFYKDTILSGVIEAERRLFVKVFADRGAHELELKQLESLRRIAPPELALASIVAAGDGVVAYELLGRASRRAPAPMLEHAALALATSAYQRRAASDVDCWSRLLEQVRRRLAHVGAELGRDQLRLLTVPPEPTLAHGDFTPWNTFTTIDDRVALVDYERVGQRAPFTDVWHLFVQPSALASSGFDSRGLIARVCAAADVDARSATAWYRAYLIEELEVDTRDWVEHDRHHPQLQRLIRYKAQLLREAPTSLP